MVENERILDQMQQRLRQRLNQERQQLQNGNSRTIDRSGFVEEMQKIAQEEGIRRPNYQDQRGKGNLRDIGSQRRLELIWDIQVGHAEGEARWRTSMDPDVLAAVPAQELVRKEARMVPRNWQRRWQQAGGQLTDGRLIALKTDPIWYRISRFGIPWPPFDFQSGMGLRNIRRRQAIQLGIIDNDWQPPQDPQQAHDDHIRRSAAQPPTASALPPEQPPGEPTPQPPTKKISQSKRFRSSPRRSVEQSQLPSQDLIDELVQKNELYKGTATQASMRGHSQESIERLENYFGDLVEYDRQEQILRTRFDRLDTLIDRALMWMRGESPPGNPRSLNLGIAGDFFAKSAQKTGYPVQANWRLNLEETALYHALDGHSNDKVPLTISDIRNLVFNWRNPHNTTSKPGTVKKGHRNRFEVWLGKPKKNSAEETLLALLYYSENQKSLTFKTLYHPNPKLRIRPE